MRKHVTILYADELLPYCPSVLNLKKSLESTGLFEVRIVTYEPAWCKIRFETPDISYRLQPKKLYRLLEGKIFSTLARRLLKVVVRLQRGRQPWEEIKKLASLPVHLAKALDLALDRRLDWKGLIIAVDPAAAFAASLRTKSFIFLSLELYENDLLCALIAQRKIKALLIQSEARKNILFPDFKGMWFLLPNSPIFKEREIPQRTKGHLIFAGTAWEQFGFESALALIEEDAGLRMTHIGFCPDFTQRLIEEKYNHLIAAQRLILHSQYVAEDDMVDAMTRFHVGLCFYRVDLAPANSRLNYLTAPSGKLFNYLAAGVPVICSDLPAFQFVSEQRCGALVKDLTPPSIRAALDLIEENYEELAGNALAVGRQSCFKKHLQPVIEFLSQEPGPR